MLAVCWLLAGSVADTTRSNLPRAAAVHAMELDGPSGASRSSVLVMGDPRDFGLIPSMRGLAPRGLGLIVVGRHATLRDLQWDVAAAGTPAAVAEALQWSIYCMAVQTLQISGPTGATIYPTPLVWPEKVRQAQARYYSLVAEARSRGEQLDTAAHQASLSFDELPHAVALSPEQAAHRSALLAAADDECRSQHTEDWRRGLLNTVKADGSSLGQLLSARHPGSRIESDADRDRANAAYRDALDRALRERDVPALQVWALFNTRVDVDWAGRGVENPGLSTLQFAGGRLALQIALCDIAVDCGADGFAARVVCLDHGACQGDSLGARLRAALVRDGLSENLFDELAREIRTAIDAGELERFGLHRRF